MDGDQMAEMRGRGKDATANIAKGTGTAAAAAAEKDTVSIGGEIETTRASSHHAATAGTIEARAAVSMMTIADDTDTMTTGLREPEVGAKNIGGRPEMDTVKDLLTDGGVSVLNADGATDERRTAGNPGVFGKVCRHLLKSEGLGGGDFVVGS